MICLTKAQRDALFRLFQRDFPSWVTPSRQNSITREEKLSERSLNLFRGHESIPSKILSRYGPRTLTAEEWFFVDDVAVGVGHD